MKSNYAIVAALFAGIALGALGVHILAGQPALGASRAIVAMSSAGPMNMSALPIGDAQMMKAMNDMAATMKTAHMNGDQDHDFMQMMIPHHEAAIKMARVELRYGFQPKLKSVARDIIKSQAAEIAQMRQWLAEWYGDARNK